MSPNEDHEIRMAIAFGAVILRTHHGHDRWAALSAYNGCRLFIGTEPWVYSQLVKHGIRIIETIGPFPK